MSAAGTDRPSGTSAPERTPLSEHVADAVALLAAVRRTERIRVGVGILPAAVRNVAYTAMEAATLAQLFPGRVDFGIGHGMPGWMRALGVWPERPLRFLGDQVVSLKALLRGAETRSLTEQLAAEKEAFVASAGTHDFAEGVAAFVAKRLPRFEGH